MTAHLSGRRGWKDFRRRWLPCFNEGFRLEPFYRYWGTRLIHRIYRPEFIGFDKLPRTGAAMIVSNHVSFVDGLILAAACPRPVRFIIAAPIYRLPIVHHFMRVNRAIPIEPTRASVTAALEAVAEALRNGELVCIFPEGQLTYTGGLSRFKPGIEWILDQAPAPVYPIALTGLWGSVFSRKHLGSWKRLVPWNFRQRVRAVCGEPVPAEEATANRLQQEVLRLKYRG